MSLKKKVCIIAAVILVLAVIWIILLKQRNKTDVVFGVTFDPEYAAYLGFDSKQAFDTILHDWKFKYIRIGARWDKIEKQPGERDFSEIDWMMEDAAKSGAKVILAIGQKTPRWPECHVPEWAANLSETDYRNKLYDYMTSVVQRYKNNPALEIWQVENEPFLPFGGACPAFTDSDLANELKLVKLLDPSHPTITTDAGELSLWRQTATKADFFGFSMYRTVWDKNFGYINYDWTYPVLSYTARLWLNGRSINTAYVTELQAEPWLPNKTLIEASVSEQFKSLDLARLKSNVEFTSGIGIQRAYLWGAEWWMWMARKGDNSFVDYIKTLKKE